jgi:2-phosphosulfolactate phosphatase
LSQAAALPPLAVCLTPALLSHFELAGKTVVVIDVIRASTTVATALQYGAASVRPVASIPDCEALGQQGYLTAGERQGRQLNGFDFGNSPLKIQQPHVRGRRIALTTTNCTKAVAAAGAAETILTAGFVNQSAVAAWLRRHARPTLLICAGWHGSINLEDTVLAGALCQALQGSHTFEDDACWLAAHAYAHASRAFGTMIRHSTNLQRVRAMHMMADAKFCLRADTVPVVPVLQAGEFLPSP